MSITGSEVIACDPLEVTCILLFLESLLTRFQPKECCPGCRPALASRVTLLRSFGFACPDSFHGWSMVIGDDLAI